MSRGRFLVGLAEVKNSEKIMLLTSLVKAEVNFWDEDIYESSAEKEQQMADLLRDVSEISVEVEESCLQKESREVAVSVAGYIARKISQRVKCDNCDPFLKCQSPEEKDELEVDYLDLLSRGGLIVPGKHLEEFVSHAFAILDLLDGDIISKYPLLPVKQAAGKILTQYLDGRISCQEHHDRVKRCVISHVTNVFYNNKTKRDADKPREDNIEKFKQKKLKLEEAGGKPK